MRRSLPWLLGLPVMAAGSLAAHSVSYLFASARTGEAAGEASERANTGSASYVVLVLGVAAATVFVAACARLALGRRKRRGGQISPSLFVVLPPLGFALQELAERLLRAEGFPFHAALEPRFLLGLVLQLPFGLLALLLARALLRVVEQLICAFARAPRRRLAATAPWSLQQALDLPRTPALALGHPQRGPPAL